MSDPAWALGYDLAFLKQVASIFARDFKPHTYGAFGLPKERDIANALKDESLVWLKSDSGTIAAAAIFKIAKSTSKQSDFAQRTITIKPGDLQIKSAAAKSLRLGSLSSTLATSRLNACLLTHCLISPITYENKCR